MPSTAMKAMNDPGACAAGKRSILSRVSRVLWFLVALVGLMGVVSTTFFANNFGEDRSVAIFSLGAVVLFTLIVFGIQSFLPSRKQTLRLRVEHAIKAGLGVSGATLVGVMLVALLATKQHGAKAQSQQETVKRPIMGATSPSAKASSGFVDPDSAGPMSESPPAPRPEPLWNPPLGRAGAGNPAATADEDATYVCEDAGTVVFTKGGSATKGLRRCRRLDEWLSSSKSQSSAKPVPPTHQADPSGDATGRAPGATVFDPDDDVIWVCVDDAGHKVFVPRADGFKGCRRLDGLDAPANGRSPEANARRDVAQEQKPLPGYVSPWGDRNQKAEPQKPLPGFEDPWVDRTQPGAVFSSDGVALTMPPGWIQIPTLQIQRLREELQRQAPTAKIPAVDYAYQEGSPEWFSYPYVSITIKRTGRIPEGELESIGKTDTASAVDTATKSFGSIVTSASAGQMLYDRLAKVVWLNTEANLVGNQRIRGITAMIPTEFGVVQVNGYAWEAGFTRFAGSFERMIREAPIDESVRYRHHVSDNLPDWVRYLWTPDALQRAVVGAILGLVGAGMAWRKRKPASSGPSDQKSG